MSHITNDSQRESNKRIDDCMNNNCEKVPIYDEDGDIMYFESRYTCGPLVKISYAQDKCSKCGLIFTY